MSSMEVIVTQKTWLSPKEVAEYLGLTVSALAHWRVHRKGPPYSKQGKVIRYRSADLENWLSESIVSPVSN